MLQLFATGSHRIQSAVIQEYPGAPAPTDEDSITFTSFLESLDKGLVAKVDFLAGGEKAYAYVKPAGGGGEPTRIRVGEGYPNEQGDGWSSPLWVVRALNDRKVRGCAWFVFVRRRVAFVSSESYSDSTKYAPRVVRTLALD